MQFEIHSAHRKFGDEMKILHLSTTSEGGAGKAALRIFQAQVAAGLDSTLVTRTETFKGEFLRAKHKVKPGNILASKLTTLFLRIVSRKEFGLLTYRSQTTLDKRVISTHNPDIVHVHNWFNLLSIMDLDWLVKNYNCVFTLHDERLLTGGCHYSLNCNKWEKLCTNCPQARIGFSQLTASGEKLSSIFTRTRNKFAVISPSGWIHTKAMRSRLGANPNLMRIIRNPMERIFYEFDARESKRIKGRIIFVATELDNPHKGLEDLIRALKMAKLNSPQTYLELELVGSGNWETNRLPQIPSVVFSNLMPEQIAERLSLADILIVPSKIDNLPSVVVEGQMAGCIVIAAAVGGIPELINHGVTGYLYSGGEVELSSRILEVLNLDDRDTKRSEIQSFIRTKLSWNKIVNETLDLYRDLIYFK